MTIPAQSASPHADLKRLISDGRFDDAWVKLAEEARGATTYTVLQSLCRMRRKLAAQAPPPPRPKAVRLALLGGVTTSVLEEPLRLVLESVGFDSAIHAAPFNTFASEMLNPRSDTVAFGPQVALLVIGESNVPQWPSWKATATDVNRVVDEVCEYWLGLCRSLHANAHCEIVLGNLHALPLRPFGAAGTKLPGEANRFLRLLNDALASRAPAYVHIFDVASLAATHGIDRWVDERFWYHAKQPVSFECLVPYVRSLAQIVAALFGGSAKCVVVDLDNTLWGGVVGDDGPDRLAIGAGDALGEAFVAFQRYLRQLKERGVLLAVCSKNDEQLALAPFTTREEMVLRRDDFAAFHANWRPKSDNLREIASALNLGLDALVFVDDNPAEREQVRRALPSVRVLEVGDDPAHFPRLLDRSGWLEAAIVSDEDVRRTAMYAENAARERLAASASDYAAYLRSLDQRAVVAPFEARHLERIVQLCNKTNQFNLTTRRMSASELEAMIDSPDYLTATVRLADRFGDNGLISVFAARAEGSELWIELWLMSCRVLQRGVEQLVCNHVVAEARQGGYRTMHGVYVPTERNALVRGHYRSLGFDYRGPATQGDHWALELERYQPFETAILELAVAPSGAK